MTQKYVQGRSIEEAQSISGITEILKVGSNENVLGASPKAKAAIQQALADAHLYPDQQEDVLLEKLAGRIGHGLTRENFVSGNGSCDVLRMIVQSFSGPGKKSLIAAPTFSMYAMLTEMFGGKTQFVPLVDHMIDLAQLAEAIDADVSLVFVCNPNNPTGTYVSQAQVENFLNRIPPGVIPVFDEAYMEFAEATDFPRMAAFVASGSRILVTRTFSKLHGLASLRVGYSFGPIELIRQVQQHKIHFNSGRLAYLGAAAAVDDENHIHNSLEMVRNGRRQYYHALEQMGIGYLPSQANFIFLTGLPRQASLICEKAIQRGIILRPTDSFGLPDNIRITIARPEENERVLGALQEILAESGS
jgi:histidinol-phosphate aminotransferase